MALFSFLVFSNNREVRFRADSESLPFVEFRAQTNKSVTSFRLPTSWLLCNLAAHKEDTPPRPLRYPEDVDADLFQWRDKRVPDRLEGRPRQEQVRGARKGEQEDGESAFYVLLSDSVAST